MDYPLGSAICTFEQLDILKLDQCIFDAIQSWYVSGVDEISPLEECFRSRYMPSKYAPVPPRTYVDYLWFRSKLMNVVLSFVQQDLKIKSYWDDHIAVAMDRIDRQDLPVDAKELTDFWLDLAASQIVLAGLF